MKKYTLKADCFLSTLQNMVVKFLHAVENFHQGEVSFVHAAFFFHAAKNAFYAALTGIVFRYLYTNSKKCQLSRFLDQICKRQ
jgi:hypothetical protein